MKSLFYWDRKIRKTFVKAEADGVSVDLESCCCKEAIALTRDGDTVQMTEVFSEAKEKWVWLDE